MTFLPLLSLIDKGYTITEIAQEILKLNDSYNSGKNPMQTVKGILSRGYRGKSMAGHLRATLVNMNENLPKKSETEIKKLPKISQSVRDKAEKTKDTTFQKLGGLYRWATTGKLLTLCKLYIGQDDSPEEEHFTKVRFDTMNNKPKLKNLYDFMLGVHASIYKKHEILEVKGLGFHSTKTKTKSIGILDGKFSEMYPYDNIADREDRANGTNTQ